jgi:hypothetical protein
LGELVLSERLSTEASFEAFHLWNHVNVQNIDKVYGAPDFLGPVPRQFGDHIESCESHVRHAELYRHAKALQVAVRMSFQAREMEVAFAGTARRNWCSYPVYTASRTALKPEFTYRPARISRGYCKQPSLRLGFYETVSRRCM